MAHDLLRHFTHHQGLAVTGRGTDQHRGCTRRQSLLPAPLEPLQLMFAADQGQIVRWLCGPMLLQGRAPETGVLFVIAPGEVCRSRGQNHPLGGQPLAPACLPAGAHGGLHRITHHQASAQPGPHQHPRVRQSGPHLIGQA